jgi:hypothetical protein
MWEVSMGGSHSIIASLKRSDLIMISCIPEYSETAFQSSFEGKWIWGKS